MKYTQQQLDEAALHALLTDAECSERQAVEGPFYSDRGITANSLLAYAKKCRDTIAKYQHGGAHAAVIKGIWS